MISSVIREILEKHAQALQLFARQWCDCPDDCLQEVLIRIAGRNEIPENWLSWLYRVVKNEAISQRRKTTRRTKHEANAGTERDNWFCPAKAGEFDTEDVTFALKQMDEKYREIVVAKIWGQLTFEQIAEAFGCSLSTAHQRYTLGLKKCKSIMVAKEKNRGRDDPPTESLNQLDATNGCSANHRPAPEVEPSNSNSDFWEN